MNFASVVSTNDEHGIVVWVVGSLIAAAIIGAITYLIRSAKVRREAEVKAQQVLESVSLYVLPHYIPPTSDEIRTGAEDHTIPHRLEKVEEEQADARIWRENVTEQLPRLSGNGLGA